MVISRTNTWAIRSRLLSSQINEMDEKLSTCLDTTGGNFVLSNPMNIDGYMHAATLAAPKIQLTKKPAGPGTTSHTSTLWCQNDGYMMLDASTWQQRFPIYESGIYTPTFSSPSNISTLVHDKSFWTRIDQVVTVYTTMHFTNTNTGNKSFFMTLPVQPISNFVSSTDLVGVAGHADVVNGKSGIVRATALARTANVIWNDTQSSTEDYMHITFSYMH